MNLTEQLDRLKTENMIVSYKIENIDDGGDVGKSNFRNSERMTLEFPNGSSLVINTFCSGSAEDTVFC